MSNAKVAPTVKVAGLGTLTLEEAHTTRKLGKDLAAKLGTDLAIVRRWATMTTTQTEVIVGEDAEGEDIALLLESSRYSVKVAAPIVKGKPAAIPATVTVMAFGTDPRSLALAAFDNGERKDGTRKAYAYGALEYVRPSGAVYVLHVKVTPSADGTEWRVSAILAQ